MGHPKAEKAGRGEAGKPGGCNADVGRAPFGAPHPADVVKAPCSAQLNRFPEPATPAPRLQLPRTAPRRRILWSLNPGPRAAPSQPNRPSRGRAPGAQHLVPPSQEAATNIGVPGRGLPHQPVLPRATGGVSGPAETRGGPETTVLSSSHSRRAPTTPQEHSGGRLAAYLCALPPGYRRAPPCTAPGFVHRPKKTRAGFSCPPRLAADSSHTSRRRPGRGRPLADGRRGLGSSCALAAGRWVPLPGSSAPRSRGQFPVLCPELLGARRRAISRRRAKGGGSEEEGPRPP